MRLLYPLNLFLLTLLLLMPIAFFVWPQEEFSVRYGKPLPIERPLSLPPSLFSECEPAFEAIDQTLCQLHWKAPEIGLPNLSQELLFHSKNGRPDALAGEARWHVSLKSSKEANCIAEGRRIYLLYQTTHSPLASATERGLYLFSPGNQPTALWFEIKSPMDKSSEIEGSPMAKEKEVIEVEVGMVNERGARVISPNERRWFTLQAQEFPKGALATWELGGCRVDATLLVRQRARWMGRDAFLELHGGEEFAEIVGKERLDFLEQQPFYSCFVALNDWLVWNEGRWQLVESTRESQNLPLLVVKKIDEKIIHFDLWDAEGKRKTALSLMRVQDHNGLPDLTQEFKFVGAKTWAQFIVECRSGGRMTLKPHDWLLLTQEGWIKLDTPKQIDDYVSHSLTGPLFVLDKMVKQNGRQLLVGHLFNTVRTQVLPIELVALSNESSLSSSLSLPPSSVVPMPSLPIYIEPTAPEGS